MTDPYKVRGEIEEITDSSSKTGAVKQAGREIKQLGTVDASFSRGQLYLLDDQVVFAQSATESTAKNLLDNVFSKGPFNPLRSLGIYNPYEAPLAEADQQAGSWRLPYSDIEGVSLLSKGNGYEIYLRPSDDRGYLYRIRNDEGTDPIGFRWLYSPNHDTAVRMAGELFERAQRDGGAVEFDAGDHFVARTQRVEFPKDGAESNGTGQARGETTTTAGPEQRATETRDRTADVESERDTDRQTSLDPSNGEPASTTESGRSVDRANDGAKPLWSVTAFLMLGVIAPPAFVLSPLMAPSIQGEELLAGAAVYTAVAQWASVLVVYGLATQQLSLNFAVVSPYAMLAVNSIIYVGLVIDVVHVRRRTDWTPRLRYYLPGVVVAWFVTIPVYLYRRYRVSTRYGPS
ncbi:hypothetical protein [Halosimplex halobium]|uniref:hypothetical protein n=1 Tax=Halosimplex halobium TaxID=3396618 RepID=UPI003F54DF75